MTVPDMVSTFIEFFKSLAHTQEQNFIKMFHSKEHLQLNTISVPPGEATIRENSNKRAKPEKNLQLGKTPIKSTKPEGKLQLGETPIKSAKPEGKLQLVSTPIKRSKGKLPLVKSPQPNV